MRNLYKASLGQDTRKSRTAIVAIILFLFFDFTALALNVWQSRKIETQAIEINLAGRQRMLSQRIVKVLLQIDKSLHATATVNLNEPLQELRLSFDLFDSTLQGFYTGAQTRGGGNEVVFLPAVTTPAGQLLVDEAVKLWKPYRSAVLQLFDAPPDAFAANLRLALEIAEASNLKLLTLMNSLTTELEVQTQREAGLIRIYQGAAFFLALANFLWAFVTYRRHLRDFSRQHNLLDDIIDKISASVFVLSPDHRILKANRTAEEMFEYAPGELFGKNLQDIIQEETDELIGYRKSGNRFIAFCEHNATILDDQELLIVTVLDVTEQRMTEANLSNLAYHDILTRLPNRLLFEDRLQVEISHAQRKELLLGVLFIDLDKFKPVNDKYGHQAGDHLLKDVAVRLKRCLRESDTVGRRGGDEFTAIIPEIGSKEDAIKIVQVILAQLSKPFHYHDIPLHISCSIGISIYPLDGSDPHTLITQADKAMYRAKQSGRNTYSFVDSQPMDDGPTIPKA